MTPWDLDAEYEARRRAGLVGLAAWTAIRAEVCETLGDLEREGGNHEMRAALEDTLVEIDARIAGPEAEWFPPGFER